MALSSMTGFARGSGQRGRTSWVWEGRSVNGRNLDLRLRLPPGSDALEPKVREAATRRLTRGSVALNLSVKREDAAGEIRLNQRALEQVLAAAEVVRAKLGGEPIRPEAVLGLRGVLEVCEPDESPEEARAVAAAMLADCETMLDDLVAGRRGEGARLALVLTEQVATIERLVNTIAESPSRKPEAIAERLREQVARILAPGVPLDSVRLYQEAALLATRADVEEEVHRLVSHIAAARELLATGVSVGRKLDFLAQEFYREANTLCSKSNDAEITRLGLDLKSTIDQMREQVQNIE